MPPEYGSRNSRLSARKHPAEHPLCFSDQQLFLHWSEHYQNHVSEVKNYFFDKPEKLLTFDITKDNSNKMINFLDTFYLNQKYWT